jgi:RNA polymerase sigma-70 factor (ECF subfamily)
MAQRLVRAQRQLRDARVPYALPGPSVWSERLTAVLAVVYLLFTEGYAPTEGSAPVRGELCDEAIRLSRLLVALVPKEGDAQALLALMLLHDARREARFFGGELVDLEEQDRARWDRGRIDDGLRALDRALDDGASGPYALQASIAAIHARAASAAATDWPQILALYDMLVATEPTPSVALNRAIAVAMASGPQAGLKALDALRLMLGDSHLFHAARASLLVRVGRPAAAERAYRAALARVRHPAERRFLERRLAACRAP